MFENRIANPKSVNAADIDPIQELKEEFKPFTVETFRKNFKTTATDWIAGKAVAGARLRSLNRESLLHYQYFQSISYYATNLIVHFLYLQFQ